MEDSVKINGYCKLVVKDADGKVLHDTGFNKNVITNVALAVFSGLVGATGAQIAATFLGLGSSATAPAKTDTTLTAEIVTNGLARKAATITRSTTTATNDTLQLDATWSVSGTSTINEAGVFNAVSSGVLISHLLTGAIGVVNGNQISVTYKIIFS